MPMNRPGKAHKNKFEILKKAGILLIDGHREKTLQRNMAVKGCMFFSKYKYLVKILQYGYRQLILKFVWRGKKYPE